MRIFIAFCGLGFLDRYYFVGQTCCNLLRLLYPICRKCCIFATLLAYLKITQTPYHDWRQREDVRNRNFYNTMNTNIFNSRISFLKVVMAVMLMAICMTTYATDQESDIFLENGKKYDLFVSWGHPSPLQVLYIRTGTESPFRSYSTGNYRGHVATWQVSDSALYLVTVDTRYHYGGVGTYWPNDSTRVDTLAKPSFFGIKSLSGVAPNKDGAVWADWFTGVLEISPTYQDIQNGASDNWVRYLYFRNGKMLKDVTLTSDDMNRFQHLKKKDKSNHELMEKYQMAYLNQCYLSYYLRSGLAHDKVIFGKHQGRFPARDFRPMLMLLYDNDPLQFPFNWENFEKNGAPVCQWMIQNDSLFLCQVTLHSGLNLFEHQEKSVELSELFRPERIVSNRVFAFWMSGEFVVEYGEEKEGMFEMSEFQIDRKQTITLDSGRVVKSEWSPSAFEE